MSACMYIHNTRPHHTEWLGTWEHMEGILPKGPYLPCVSMADRALLAGYHQYHLHSLLRLEYTPGTIYFLTELESLTSLINGNTKSRSRPTSFLKESEYRKLKIIIGCAQSWRQHMWYYLTFRGGENIYSAHISQHSVCWWHGSGCHEVIISHIDKAQYWLFVFAGCKFHQPV